MRRVDYINNEPVMCFYTPVINLNACQSEVIQISKGDFVNFQPGMYVPVSTYYYKYKQDLLIFDYNREDPIIHIIKQAKVIDTVRLEEVSDETLNKCEQIIDIQGKILKIKTKEELEQLKIDTCLNKKRTDEAYYKAKSKLSELINSSDNMRQLDKSKGTKKIVEFIKKDNFNKIRISILNIHNSKASTVELFKQELLKLDSFRIYTAISNILEKELYLDFKIKNKEHIELLNKAKREVDKINAEYIQKWYQEDLFIKEKQLGVYYDCLNEMYCSKDYTEEDIHKIENIMLNFIKENEGIIESYIDWVDLCEIDKEDLLDAFNEIVSESKKESSDLHKLKNER